MWVLWPLECFEGDEGDDEGDTRLSFIPSLVCSYVCLFSFLLLVINLFSLVHSLFFFISTSQFFAFLCSFLYISFFYLIMLLPD